MYFIHNMLLRIVDDSSPELMREYRNLIHLPSVFLHMPKGVLELLVTLKSVTCTNTMLVEGYAKSAEYDRQPYPAACGPSCWVAG